MVLINLVNELAEVLDFQLDAPKLKYTLFEDSQSAIEVAKSPTMLPRTKHISLKHYHFRQHGQDGSMSIQHAPAEHQIGDTFTKPLPSSSIRHLRQKIMGW